MRTRHHLFRLILLSSAVCLGLLLGACGATNTPGTPTPTPSDVYPYPYGTP